MNSDVIIVLDTEDENPSIDEVAAFLADCRNHGADGDTVVDVRTKHLRVIL